MPQLPRLYAIVDAAMFQPEHQQEPRERLFAFAEELLASGVRLLQYRDKLQPARTVLSNARELRRLTRAAGATLILNDRVDLCLAAECDGVHLGQDDLSPEAARRILTAGGLQATLGLSTHNVEQARAADAGPADYIAIGPVFATGSKQNPEPVVGLEGVRAVRALTRKPLVAIGGITVENAADVIAAGADSVAVISALREEPRKSVEAFLRVLG